jgi:hypothetical protein
MIFNDLKSACAEFRTLLRDTTSRDLIDQVFVDEPIEPQDELHFIKLVSWCYIFIWEASRPTVRFIQSLLRKANPEQHRIVSATLENVNNLRTVRMHNLLPQNGRDDHKRRQAHIWLAQNGGDLQIGRVVVARYVAK